MPQFASSVLLPLLSKISLHIFGNTLIVSIWLYPVSMQILRQPIPWNIGTPTWPFQSVPVSSVRDVNFNLLVINQTCAICVFKLLSFFAARGSVSRWGGDLFSLRRMLHFCAFGFASLSEMSFCL